jgi:hypothetical protein
VTGSAVSVSSRFASSSRCVCAYSIGETPNSASKIRRRWRLVTPTRADRCSMPPSSSTPFSIEVDGALRQPRDGVDARVAGRQLGPAAQAGAIAFDLRRAALAKKWQFSRRGSRTVQTGRQ